MITMDWAKERRCLEGVANGRISAIERMTVAQIVEELSLFMDDPSVAVALRGLEDRRRLVEDLARYPKLSCILGRHTQFLVHLGDAIARLFRPRLDQPEKHGYRTSDTSRHQSFVLPNVRANRAPGADGGNDDGASGRSG
jgi:hypothetical protein